MLINFVDGAVIFVPSEHALPLAGIKISKLCCPLYLLIFNILTFKSSTVSKRVLILAAGGPYWVLISQKNGSLLVPYLKAWGSLLVLEAVVKGVWR